MIYNLINIKQNQEKMRKDRLPLTAHKVLLRDCGPHFMYATFDGML